MNNMAKFIVCTIIVLLAIASGVVFVTLFHDYEDTAKGMKNEQIGVVVDRLENDYSLRIIQMKTDGDSTSSENKVIDCVDKDGNLFRVYAKKYDGMYGLYTNKYEDFIKLEEYFDPEITKK